MIAGPDSTIATMKRALAYSVRAFEAAADLDFERTDEDRAFFDEQKAGLAALLAALMAHGRAIEDHELNVGSRLQTRVEMGDLVLDRGVSDGNARTKLALKTQSGLGAAHVFGQRVTSLTEEKLALEPQKVRLAAARLDDVPDFPERAAIAADLVRRADQQQACLDERAAGQEARAKLVGTALRLVLDAAQALASTKGALDMRFPRQRDYVRTFFLNVGSKHKAPRPAAELEDLDPTIAEPA